MAKQMEPLTESYFYILLCLYSESNHGYGIMQKTEALSEGRVKIGSGTMYGATGNMMKKGWIEECGSSRNDNERRRMYELTSLGRQVFEEECRRLEKLVNNSRNSSLRKF